MTWPFEDKVLDVQSALINAIRACSELLHETVSHTVPDCAPMDIAWELQGCLQEVVDLIKKYRAEATEAAEWLNPKPDDTDPGPSQEQRS